MDSPWGAIKGDDSPNWLYFPNLEVQLLHVILQVNSDNAMLYSLNPINTNVTSTILIALLNNLAV